MKKGFTRLVFIPDKSGSMSVLKEDTIGGFNSLVENSAVKHIGSIHRYAHPEDHTTHNVTIFLCAAAAAAYLTANGVFL